MWSDTLLGFAYVLSMLALVATVLPVIVNPHWSFRVWDFPRLQITVLAGIGLAMLITLMHNDIAQHRLHYLMVGLLCLTLVYQLWWILPYTLFAKKHVKDTDKHCTHHRLRLLAANVLQSNRDYDKLLQQIDRTAPDIIVTLETDDAWQKALTPLHDTYPYRVAVPQDNLYGMHVYSRLAMTNTNIHFRVRDDIPSISADISLDKAAQPIHLYFIHPMPPSPSEASESTSRDQELILVAREIDNTHAYIVAGDLNDVAWSRTTRLFRKLSGLLDPRVGRGFFNTFHTKWPIFRWPLDHVFVSRHFTVNTIKRLPDIGSDHFPIMLDVSYHPEHVNPKSDEQEEAPSPLEKMVLQNRMEEG